MRKLLSGYLYRLLKGYELWVLIVLYAAASLLLIYVFAQDKNYITITRGNFTLRWGEYDEIAITKDNVKDLKYESLDVSESHLYGIYYDPIPKQEYDAIENSVAISERNILLGLIEFLHIVPSVIVLILIPDFFGTMFKDRTIKNLIACGHSKGMIYLSALVFSFFLNLAMIFATITICALLCLFYMWIPPVYLPVVLVMLLVEILITFTLSSISLAVVFISEKRTVGFVASFLMAVLMFNVYIGKYEGGGEEAISKLYYELNNYEEFDDAVWEEYRNIVKNEGVYSFEMRFDVFEFRDKTYYKGRELKFYTQNPMDPVQKTARMAMIYIDPLMVQRFESFGFEAYTCCRDGLMTIELANNVFWILVSTAAGMVVFKKKEVKG